jgi:NADH-quinone oxidoreductase subunit L
MGMPLVVLIGLSIGGGWLNVPAMLDPSFSQDTAFAVEALTTGLALLGVYLAYVLYLRHPQLLVRWQLVPGAERLYQFSLSGLGFDRLYNVLIISPFLWLVRANRDEIINAAYNLVAAGVGLGHRLLRHTQTGIIRWYAVGIACGTIVMLSVVVWM